MSDSEDRQFELSQLAHEYAEMVRNGSRATIEEFAAVHPLHARDIRDFFPTLIILENIHDTSTEGDEIQDISNQFGEFRILRKVGEGGMGQVYEAIQEPLGRQVALKILRKVTVSRRLKQRFAREARVLAKLHHPNIVSLFEFGEIQGIHYFAMQFVRGKSLDDFLRYAALKRAKASKSLMGEVAIGCLSDAGPSGSASPAVFDCLLSLPPQEYQKQMALLGFRLADALGVAHSSGVVHRDVKPANILIDDSMNVWLADFGLAFVDGDTEITKAGDVFGTLRYLPPERFQGETDARGDVYSLGITLYEMLSQQAVFSGASRAELILKILNEPPVPLRKLSPLISRDLETVVHKAMAYEIGDRYQSAKEFADELHRCYSEVPIRARRRSIGEKVRRSCRRNPIIASMGAVIGLLLLLVTIVSVSSSMRLHKQFLRTLVAERKGKERLYDSLLVQASVIRKSNDTGRRFRALGILQDAALVADQLGLSNDARHDLRDEAIATLCIADAKPQNPIAAWPMGAAALDFDLIHERVARMNTSGEISIVRINKDWDNEIIPGRGDEFSARSNLATQFSPDGNWLIQWLRNEQKTHCVRLWNVASSPAVMTNEWSDEVADFCGFTPDSRYVAIRAARNPETTKGSQLVTEPMLFEIRLFAVESSAESLAAIESTATSVIAFDPEMRSFAISADDQIQIVDFVSREQRDRWPLRDSTHLLFSVDGDSLFAATSADAIIHCWSVSRQCEQQNLVGDDSKSITQLITNHHGDTLVTASQFEFQAWEIRSRRLLWQSGSQSGNLRFSLDDRYLAAIHRADPKVSILELAGSASFRRIATDLSPSEGDVVATILHPSRNLFAATTADGILLWDLDHSKQCGFLAGRRIPICFDSDNSLLTYAKLPEGVQRWEFESTTTGTHTIAFAPSEAIFWVDDVGRRHQLVGTDLWSSSRSGDVLAMAAHSEGAFVYVADHLGTEPVKRVDYRRLKLGPQHDVCWTSVSPNGEWVVTGSSRWFAGEGDPVSVTVWDAATGERFTDLLTGDTGIPKISPNGRCLSVLSGSYRGGVRCWDMATWKPFPEPGPEADPSGITSSAFDQTRGLLAVQGVRIRILDVATGSKAFSLDLNEATSLAPQFFTADGSHLVGVDWYSGEVLIWDLNLIFEQLRSLGLDR